MIRETRPDLVITDIKMPHMDGIEMTEIIMQEMPDLQVLIISGYDEFEYAKRAMKAGVSEYILKPIKMDDLKDAIGKMQAKLLKRQKEKEELEQLKSSHRHSRRVQRASLYTGLLLQGTKLEEMDVNSHPGIEDRFFLAGLIAFQNFSVLYMDCEYSLVIEKDQELGRIIEECVQTAYEDAQREKVEILRTSNGERLICIYGDTRDEVRELQEKFEDWISREKQSKEQLDVSFGQVSTGLEGLRNSYLLARKRSEEKFMKSWQNAAVETDKAGMVNFLNYDLSNLCYEIKSGSRHGVQKEVNALKEMLSSKNISSYLQLVLVISNIYYELIRIPEEAGGNIEAVVEDAHIYYQHLISKMKREEMLNELEGFCIKLHDYYQQLSSDRKQEVMHRIDAYMKEHFSQEDLSMKDVAEHAYISVSYLGMIMKKETGKTFTEYLTDIRVEKAKQMLSQGKLKNYEIAEACGYTTPAYFSTVFKGATGKTPTEYRNSLKEAWN